MKKLITLLLLFSYAAKAQEIQPDKVDHFAVGYVISAMGNGLTYAFLTENRIMKSRRAKIVSFCTGIAISSLAGHLKEKRDKIYSKKDLQATALGGFAGSITISLIINKSIPRHEVPEELIRPEDFPLITKLKTR